MLCLMDIAIWEKGKKVLKMDEYIKREDAIEAVKHAWGKGLEPSQYIEIIPASDVAPVRHGRWICIRKGYEEYECSVCHGMDSNCSDYYSDHVVTEQEYCPFCGAKMDGGAD